MNNSVTLVMRKPAGWLVSLALVIFVLVRLVSFLSPDPQNKRVAAGLVESAYRTACSSAAGEQYDHSGWERIESQYGRVRNWRVLAQRRTFLGHQWDFHVEVTRERAVTRERVQADAGPSKLYGYYSSLSGVHVVSAHP